MELVIVTGLSGAGRRSVLSALEDAGSTAIDNIPASMLQPLLEIEAKLNPQRPSFAIGMDNRHEGFASEFAPMLQRLTDGDIPVHVVFVEADDHTLLRRYSESRRPHYLAGTSGNLAEAIRRERALLAPIRACASAIIDTSRLTLSQMRMRLSEVLPSLPSQSTTLRLLSFGFKFGLPEDADMVLDARFLPNPFYIPELRPLTGKDQPVLDYLNKSDAFGTFLALAENWLHWAWPYIQQDARAYHTVAIGCTGGQHRSVALVELLADRLKSAVSNLSVQHRELKD